MRKITLLLAFIAITTLAMAQSAPLSKGEKQLNFGLGFGSGLPAYFGMDFAVHDDITLGGTLGVNLDGFDYLSIAGRGDYHFNRIIGIPSEWDFYAGLNLGFVTGLNDYTGTSGLDLGAQVGGRYYWNDKWGINLEAGGGMINYGGKVGLTMKL
jgi:hypothetical protein